MSGLVERLRALRSELELRFTGQFVENAVCTLDSAKSALEAAQARIAELEAQLAGAREAALEEAALALDDKRAINHAVPYNEGEKISLADTMRKS